jgi:hypothetical protein
MDSGLAAWLIEKYADFLHLIPPLLSSLYLYLGKEFG